MKSIIFIYYMTVVTTGVTMKYMAFTCLSDYYYVLTVCGG